MTAVGYQTGDSASECDGAVLAHITAVDLGRRRIQRVTTCGVAGLALAGFAMSYEALHALAHDSGVSTALACLWPLVVDGFIVVASMSVVRAVIESRPAWHPWALLLVFSTISVAGNVAHGPPTAVGRLVAAVPPVALVLAFDLLMRQVQLRLGDPRTVACVQNEVDDQGRVVPPNECAPPSQVPYPAGVTSLGVVGPEWV